MKRNLLFALVPFLALSGCLDTDFETASIVATPRILGIVVSPPEAAFGQDIIFEALTADASGRELAGQDGVELEWTVCLSLRSVVAGVGLPTDGLTDNCDSAGDDLVRLSSEGLDPNQARLEGARVLELAVELMEGGGGGTPPPGLDPSLFESLLVVLATVGVPLRVSLEIRRQGEILIDGFKRFAFTMRDPATTNPPAPRIAVQVGAGEARWLSARGAGNERECLAEGDAPARVAPGGEVNFAPDEEDESWLERYPVITLDGSLQMNIESAYYSWFSLDGSFESEITQRPNRETVWTAPEEVGTYPFWVVVRDGHLGASYCRFELRVAE